MSALSPKADIQTDVADHVGAAPPYPRGGGFLLGGVAPLRNSWALLKMDARKRPLLENNNDVIMLGATNCAFGVAVAPGGIG